MSDLKLAREKTKDKSYITLTYLKFCSVLKHLLFINKMMIDERNLFMIF